HHEAVREIEGLGPGRRGRAVDGSNGRDPIPVDDDHRVANRRRADAVEEHPAADRADAHGLCISGRALEIIGLALRATSSPPSGLVAGLLQRHLAGDPAAVPSLTLSNPRSSRSEISWSSTLFV